MFSLTPLLSSVPHASSSVWHQCLGYPSLAIFQKFTAHISLSGSTSSQFCSNLPSAKQLVYLFNYVLMFLVFHYN